MVFSALYKNHCGRTQLRASTNLVHYSKVTPTTEVTDIYCEAKYECPPPLLAANGASPLLVTPDHSLSSETPFLTIAEIITINLSPRTSQHASQLPCPH